MLIVNSNPNLFIVFEVKMLHRIKGSGVAAGRKAYGCEIPNGRVYLSKSGKPGTSVMGPVFSTDAVEGTDFVRV